MLGRILAPPPRWEEGLQRDQRVVANQACQTPNHDVLPATGAVMYGRPGAEARYPSETDIEMRLA